MVVVLCSVSASSTSAAPNPIYHADSYMKILRLVEKGKRYEVSAPNNTTLSVVHLFGNASERGTAYGQLLSEELLDFFNNKMPQFYSQEVDKIPLQLLPAWLQKMIKGLLKSAAPKAFELALEYVYSTQKQYNRGGRANVWDEADGIIEGACFVQKKKGASCDVAALKTKIRHVNMLPELIRMQCSMMGAWGSATPDTKLVQLRSLDFGGGPFANSNILVVHHPTESKIPFATLSFPGFVGVVTGFSEKIGQSEKVDDVTGGARPKGSYKGQAVAFVIRDMLQFAETKEEAVAIAQGAHRTWSVWLGVGDYASQAFDAILYDKASVTAFSDTSLPTRTNQTYFKDVAYIDKHPQPSLHSDMPALVKRFYGNISAENVAQYFPRLMGSGDVHVAVYDFARKKALIATGITDATGQTFTRKASDAPFLSFDMQELWSETQP